MSASALRLVTRPATISTVKAETSTTMTQTKDDPRSRFGHKTKTVKVETSATTTLAMALRSGTKRAGRAGSAAKKVAGSNSDSSVADMLCKSAGLATPTASESLRSPDDLDQLLDALSPYPPSPLPPLYQPLRGPAQDCRFRCCLGEGFWSGGGRGGGACKTQAPNHGCNLW